MHLYSNCITHVLMSSVVCCRLGERSNTSGPNYVRCLSSVLDNPSVQHRHVQSTQRHQRRRNERFKWHRRLPWWSTAVYRRGVLYLACGSGWSVVREVADDWTVLLQLAVTDVTSTAGDITTAASSTPVQRGWQTTAACCLNATVHEVPVPRRWDDTRHVCRQSPRHIRRWTTGRGEWTV